MRYWQSIVVERVVLSPRTGANIADVMYEALTLAASERRSVEFEFNGKVYLIDPENIIAGLKEKP